MHALKTKVNIIIITGPAFELVNPSNMQSLMKNETLYAKTKAFVENVPKFWLDSVKEHAFIIKVL